MIKCCIYCKENLELNNSQQFGAHVTNCKQNPKRKNRLSQISSSKTIKRVEYVISCKVCDKQFPLLLRPNQFLNRKHRQTCSKECQHSRTLSSETKLKISLKLTGKPGRLGIPTKKGITYADKKCESCHEIFKIVAWKKTKFCSKTCLKKFQSYSHCGTKNPMYGKVPTHHNYQGGYFYSIKNNCNIHYRSSYELKALNILENDSLVLSFEYESIRIPYNNNTRTTIPDFIVKYIDCIKMIEIKCNGLLNKYNNPVKIRAMKKYCKKNSIIFEIWTELALGIKNKI